MRAICGILLLAMCISCAPRYMTLNLGDAKLEAFANMYTINRQELGLSALPATGRVKIRIFCSKSVRNAETAAELESWQRLDGREALSRVIRKVLYFKKVDGAFVLVNEAETIWGPQRFEAEHGIERERLEAWYEVAPSTQGPSQNPYWQYWGDRYQSIAAKVFLSSQDIAPILTEWGYRK